MAALGGWAKAKFANDTVPQAIKGLMKPIDVDALATKLSLSARGNESGARESPPSSAISFDIVEQEIIGHLTNEWTLQRSHLISMLRAYRDRLAELNAASAVAALRLSAEEAISRFTAARQQVKADLIELRKAYIEADNELSSFKIEHNLSRPARYPSNRYTTVGLLVVLVAFESVLNGFFFAKGSETGLIGGIGIAIGISVFNVMVCFFLGWGPARYINWRKNWLIRVGAFLLSFGMLGCVALLHFFAAHFRDATAAIGETKAYAVAVDHLLHSPLAFTDISSWYLFALGLALGLIALWKGYSFDDPYPRYGSTNRRQKDAYERYAEEHDDFFKDLEGIRDKTIGEFRAGLANIPEYVKKSDQVRAARVALIEEFKAYERNLEQSANRLLTIYQQSCQMRRSTPNPSYFFKEWKLPASATAGSEIMMLMADAPEMTVGDVNRSLEEINSLSAAVIAKYDELVAAIEHPLEKK